MKFIETILPGAYIIELTGFADERGFFARTYCKNEFQQIGFAGEWLQMNHSITNLKGSIRGMHFQNPPFSEVKMVKCIAGAVFDVIVDIRKNSPTFLKWYGAEISAENKKMMFIPDGFAHGFQTLTDDCGLIYHHSNFYTPAAEAGLKYNDPFINIEWPLAITTISERDKNHPYLTTAFKGI